MPLESIGDPILPDELNPLWPLATDTKSEGDDHIRNTKAALYNFYSKVNFSGLSVGAVPAFVGGKFVDSGFAFTGGQATLMRPFTAPMHIQAGGLNPAAYQLIGVSLADTPVKRPETPTANGVYELDIQTDDSGVNAGPIGWAFTQDSEAWVTGIIVRGAAIAANVRITLRDATPSGAILYQTASDAELISGGGVNIAASGDTQITFPQKLEMFTGNTVYVVVDRYDATAGAIVTSGISLKGAIISGSFIPYQRSIRQAITRKPVVVKSDLPTLSYLADASAQTITTSVATVGNFVYTNADAAGVYYLDTSVFLQNLPNAQITVDVLINGVLVNTGSGFTSRINNPTAGMAYSIKVDIPITLNAGANTIEIKAITSAGSANKILACAKVCRVDTGGVWA